MNIDVFKAVDQLRAELSSVLDIDSISLQFETVKSNNDKDLSVLIFYYDSITGDRYSFTTNMYCLDTKKITLNVIKMSVLYEIDRQGIVKRVPAKAYSFNTSQK
jgi:hypothetical protein